MPWAKKDECKKQSFVAPGQLWDIKPDFKDGLTAISTRVTPAPFNFKDFPNLALYVGYGIDVRLMLRRKNSLARFVFDKSKLPSRGRPGKLVLTSQPGRALVINEDKEGQTFHGNALTQLTIGDVSKAATVEIDAEGHFFLGGEGRDRSFQLVRRHDP